MPSFDRTIHLSRPGAPVGGTIDWHKNISDPSDPSGFLGVAFFDVPFLMERVNASVDKLEYLHVFTGRLEGIHACININMRISNEHHLFIHDKPAKQ